MNNTFDTRPVATKEEITALAYQIWDKAGRPAGRDLEFWLQAEDQLLSAPAAPPAHLTGTKFETMVATSKPSRSSSGMPKSRKKNARF